MPLLPYISDRLNSDNLSIIYDTVGSPVGFDTTIITLDNGYQYAFDRYDQPRAKFNIGDRIYKKTEWDYLKNFFYNVRGSAIAFRYKNWGDYQGINQAIAIGNGIKRDFQLVKNYDGYQKIIEKPINATVFVNGILVTSGLTIFYESGIIVFAVAPITGTVITASFEFDLKVRFETDSISGRLEAARTFDKEEFISVPTVAIVELRSPFAVYFLGDGSYTVDEECPLGIRRGDNPPPLGVPSDFPLGWYVIQVWSLPFNAQGGLSNITVFSLMNTDESSVWTTGSDDCGGGGKTAFLNGLPYTLLNGTGCMSDNIQNVLISAEYLFYYGNECL